jgi:hypothetical protein
LVFELLNPLAVLKIYPDINATITIGICLLGNNLPFIVNGSKIKDARTFCVPLFAHELIIFKVVNRIPFAGAFGVTQPLCHSPTGKKFDHIHTAAVRGVLLSADDLVTAKVDDSANLAVPVEILLLFDQAAILIITPKVDFAGLFAIELFTHQLAVLKIRKSIGLAVSIGVFFNPNDLAIFVKNAPLSSASITARFIASHRLPILVIDPQGWLAGMVCILTLALHFAFAVEINPSVDLPVIFAGDFLTDRSS